jgi:hypothetical protein
MVAPAVKKPPNPRPQASASAAFFARVRIDFPHITSLQDVSHLLPDSIRSLARLL